MFCGFIHVFKTFFSLADKNQNDIYTTAFGVSNDPIGWEVFFKNFVESLDDFIKESRRLGI